MRFRFCLFLLLLLGVAGARRAGAHPMGNFSINHYARFEVKPGFLALRTVLDFAEIPTSERMPQLDVNGDGSISETEKRAFLQSEIAASASGYSVKINGKGAAMQRAASKLDVRPGAGGLQTLRVVSDWKVALPAAKLSRVEFRDANFEGRNGWMEIVALSGAGLKIADSDASRADRSRELTIFPTGQGSVAPRQREASFSLFSGNARLEEPLSSTSSEPKPATPDVTTAAAPATNTQTPQNRFTQSIAEKQLTPGLILGGFLAALAFGAVHALSPGHGKTMVAAYLVGSRGTPKHAVTLGLVVTITHTLGVFALGMALLFASRYVLPERLFPILSAASGLLIFGVGLWLFMSRYQDLTRPQQDHSHDHDHSHEDGEHTHEHGEQVHSHGGRAHSHAVPDGPITLKTLVALGVSGGIVPCPEALVVLLAAVKLHRIGYGMLLITAFSIGLAAALIAIGLFVVAARARFGSSMQGKGGVLTRYLPLGSAAAITLIGIVLTLQATTGGP